MRGARIRLPLLLAGPVARRAEPHRVCLWLATSAPRRVRAEIYSSDSGGLKPIGSGPAVSLQLGERLFIHLVSASPSEGRFPTATPLAYDIELVDEATDEASRLGDLGLLDGPSGLTYEDMSLPAIFLSEGSGLHLLHGSCRLLHGGGEDAFLAADEAVANAGDPIDERPAALFLTGDQIYADNVAGPMIAHIRELASALMGRGDASSLPNVPDLHDVPVYGREDLVRELTGFTTPNPDNHLLTFGEFAAMYLMAWNPDVWPLAFEAASVAVSSKVGHTRSVNRERRLYLKEMEMLERARAALPAVRRVLANVPTFMIFDDHDVTDDWNLTKVWKEKIRARPTGRRVVSNALAAYWAFQGWGNDPESMDGEVADAVVGFLSESRVDGDAFDSTMWEFDRWSFFAPTAPPTVVLDTRTQRHYDSPEGGARLLGEAELQHVAEVARSAGHKPGSPLVLVSAVPVFGFELQERRQKYLVGKVGPYEIDFEAWHSNLRGFVDLMRLLVERLQPSPCIILSGDVHYAVNALASFAIDDNRLPIIQVVSSGFKHASVAAKTALSSLGRLLHKRHVREGWDKPPDHKAPRFLSKRILSRSVNVDEWADHTPVFLAPRDVRLLGIESGPDYREERTYVRPDGRSRSILIGENNVGLVSVYEDSVVHRVLSRGRRETKIHRAELRHSATNR